jgi:CRP-like cAMP-binding protein
LAASISAVTTFARANRILRSLPVAAVRAVAGRFEHKAGKQKDHVFRRDEPISHVAFVLSGVVSIVTPALDDDGGSIEVATVGNEGMVGLPLFLGTPRAALDAFVQVPGELLLMSARHFAQWLEDEPRLTRVLNLYTQALITQIAQSSACNRLHPVQERCARWLLMTHDRVNSDSFSLTHEFLAQMLGVRRASVSTTAAALQGEGLIRYERGIIEILDRPRLEDAACECYQIIEKEYTRLVGARPPASQPSRR